MQGPKNPSIPRRRPTGRLIVGVVSIVLSLIAIGGSGAFALTTGLVPHVPHASQDRRPHIEAVGPPQAQADGDLARSWSQGRLQDAGSQRNFDRQPSPRRLRSPLRRPRLRPPKTHSHGRTPDTTAPNTSITASPPASTTETAASFSFTSTETRSTFACKLDSASWAPCTSPRTYSSLALGAHTFSVRATDAAGNTDASPASATWTVVDTRPRTRDLDHRLASGLDHRHLPELLLQLERDRLDLRLQA